MDDTDKRSHGRLINPWEQAARDLGVDITAPYRLRDESPGNDLECLAYLKDFGSPRGAVVLARSALATDAQRIADRQHMFWAVLDETSYETYNRYRFEGTINSWGWSATRHRVRRGAQESRGPLQQDHTCPSVVLRCADGSGSSSPLKGGAKERTRHLFRWQAATPGREHRGGHPCP